MPLERRAIDAALKNKGFRVDTLADHDKYWLHHNGVKQAIYTKLSRGTNYRTIGDDLVSKIARQVKLPRRKFEELVDCSLSEADYIAFLTQSGISLTPTQQAAPQQPQVAAPLPVKGKTKGRRRP